jgi:hypothetical protein
MPRSRVHGPVTTTQKEDIGRRWSLLAKEASGETGAATPWFWTSSSRMERVSLLYSWLWHFAEATLDTNRRWK